MKSLCVKRIDPFLLQQPSEPDLAPVTVSDAHHILLKNFHGAIWIHTEVCRHERTAWGPGLERLEHGTPYATVNPGGAEAASLPSHDRNERGGGASIARHCRWDGQIE